MKRGNRMAYKKSVYLKAKAALDARRAASEQMARLRHEEVLRVCPALEDVEREMTACGAEVIRRIAGGEDCKQNFDTLKAHSLAMQQERARLLKEHGFAADYLDNVYTCPVCQDTGTHGSYYCDCYLALVRETAKKEIKAAQLGQCTFETFDLRYYSDTVDPQLGKSHRQVMAAVLQHFKNYAEQFTPRSRGAILLGKTGLGKTHLSLAVVNRLVERGFNVYYDSAAGLLNRLEKQRFSKNDTDDELEEDIFSSDLLVIDDLGTEFTTSFTTAAIYDVLNTRLNRGLPTFFNSNMTLNEIEERYSQRFTSRVVGNCDIVGFYGKDIRQQKIREKF